MTRAADAVDQNKLLSHAGLVADCRCLISYSQHDSASRILSPIFPGFRLLSAPGGFAGMTSRFATI